jgi:hypothetical protein
MTSTISRGLIAVVLVVIGHVVVFVAFSHPWAVFTERQDIVGLFGLAGSEVLRTLPRFGYFLLVGLFLGHIFGPFIGAKWALLAAVIAMAIDALLQKMVFPDGIDLFGLVLLGINYLLPVAIAVAAALVSRLWRNTRGGSIAT